MKELKEIAKLAAKSHSSVLIYGETGTGKEYLPTRFTMQASVITSHL